VQTPTPFLLFSKATRTNWLRVRNTRFYEELLERRFDRSLGDISACAAISLLLNPQRLPEYVTLSITQLILARLAALAPNGLKPIP